MKIGILTLPLVDNYGGILQTVALCKFLEKNGHELVLINKNLHIPLWKKSIKYFLSLIFPKKYDIKNQIKRKKIHKGFIENKIKNISKILITTSDLKNYVKSENFDAIIVGSDQVWRKQYINDKYYKTFFLDFVNENTKKIAYAASFGKNQWEGENDIDEISLLLNKFNAISTREITGVELLNKIFNYKKATHVLDPTLLMNKNFYIDNIIEKNSLLNINRGGITTYVLDEANNKKEIIDFISNTLNIKSINHLKGFKHSNTTYTIPQWLLMIAYCDFVVTDSFHGMIFSIIFEKNFLIIGNQNRGLERFTSLLSELNLLNRLISKVEQIKPETYENIDYNKVNNILDKKREESINFLNNSLMETN
jgi:hypothetical protein